VTRFFYVLALALAACASPQLGIATDPATQTRPGPTARPSPALTRVVRFGLPGREELRELPPPFVMDVPTAWTADLQPRSLNRAATQLVAVGNGQLHELPTVPGNGDVDPLQLPRDRVLVQIQYQCRIVCHGPGEETAFPLTWSVAAPFSAEREAVFAAAGVHELVSGFRYFDEPLVIIARWGDGTPPGDIAAIAGIVASIRPDPAAPTTGEFRGWTNVGPLADLPVGTVRLTPLPEGAVLRPAYRLYDTAPFFVVRGKQNIYALSSRPLVDQRCEAIYDPPNDRFHCVVDGRQLSWTRFGHYLGPEPASEMPEHRVIVRDGFVWVYYFDTGRFWSSARDEAAER